jgi:hypothetical protein
MLLAIRDLAGKAGLIVLSVESFYLLHQMAELAFTDRLRSIRSKTMKEALQDDSSKTFTKWAVL